MNGIPVLLAGTGLTALGSGALWWPERRLLCVSDLHLGKAERIARLGGALLPPYEGRETLARLDADVEATDPATVVCLGDSFDDPAAAASLHEDEALWLARLQAGRRWIWIAGNHDPGPLATGGSHLAELAAAPLVFRHIADPAASGEISGHYHPKATLALRGRHLSRPCFLIDARRIILPAYGAYTGGLRWTDRAFSALMGPAQAVVTGPAPCLLPVPRVA